ncbi:twin-arginine translocase subunit TatC [Candidatus Pantoea carbekii]|nr:twin-arginine translocase subunit TatC [Candidatus Pantoea carbekii]AKC32260.1 Sec-independent protein translocase protein TatC [Candidatus Pantoea carbekii]
MSVEDTEPLINHFVELRKRLLNCIISIVFIFLILVYFSKDIYYFIALPLLHEMPAGAKMIATDITAPFLAPMKLTIMVAIFFSVPMILYQVWAFIAPALYHHERKMVIPLFFFSTLLFYLGVFFAYFIVLPIIFNFLAKTIPNGINLATDITNYLDFILTIFIAFGVVFEVPITIVLLCWSGITTPETLKQKRPYIFVSAFVIGMFLTPPDVFSQTLLAIPTYCLFEIGLFLSRYYIGKKV